MLDESGDLYRVVSKLLAEGPLSEPRFVVEPVHDARQNRIHQSSASVLTARERQIAVLLISRATNREIAREIGISPHTARHHSQSVLDKLGVRSRSHVRRALVDAGKRPARHDDTERGK